MKSAQRALIECRRRGWTCGIVERSIPTGGNQFIRTRVDLFGLFDIVAMDEHDGVAGVQACLGDVMAHVNKVECDDELRANMARWLSRGNRAIIMGFRKVVVRRANGMKAKKKRWKVRTLVAALADGHIVWSDPGAPPV